MNKKYIFIAKMALEFRLSLDNLCKLLGREINENMKMDLYKNIELTIPEFYMQEKYKYLFFYETLHEEESVSKIAYERALNFLKRYKKASKEGKEEVNKILSELSKTDKDFQKIKLKPDKTNLSDEEIEIVTRYRVKYSMPRKDFAEYYGFSSRSLEKRDRNVKDETLKKKVQILGEYFMDYRKERFRKKQ